MNSLTQVLNKSENFITSLSIIFENNWLTCFAENTHFNKTKAKSKYDFFTLYSEVKLLAEMYW